MVNPSLQPRCRRSVNLRPKLARRVDEELGEDGNFNDLVSRALWMHFARVETRSRSHEYMELTLLPSGESSVDQMMEWILARQPLVWDMSDQEGELQRSVVRVIRDLLPKVQARRMMMRFKGQTLDEIGRKEQCSKQAVHTSLTRASRTLGTSERFAAVLIRVLGREDDGLTPQLLVEAAARRRGNDG